jgi:hypothetical protein
MPVQSGQGRPNQSQIKGVDPSLRGGIFYAAQNRIAVEPALLSQPSAVLGAVLTHELTHAATFSPPADPRQVAGYCVANEMLAYSTQANYWYSVRVSSPYPFDASPWAQEFDRIVAYWQSRRLREMVLLSPAHQQECFGPLPNF